MTTPKTSPAQAALNKKVADMPLEWLSKALDDLGADMHNPNPKEPRWIAFTALSREFHRRMAAHYATVCDEEAVAVMTLTMCQPWKDKTTSAQVVADAVENELRARFAGAAQIADAFLDGVSLDDESVGEYDHLRVLVDSTGVKF